MTVAAARPLADPTVRRIAIVRARVGLGDLLISVPALRAIRAARPDLHVTFVSYPEAAPIVARQAAYVDDFLPFPGYPGIPDRPVDHTALDGFLARCRARRFDLAVQMYGRGPAANDVTQRLGAGRVGGFAKPGRWEADLALHLPYPERLPEVERHLALVRFLGVPAGDDHLEFPITPAERRQAEALVGPGPYAVVHPGATAPSRRWPPERFAAVVDGLADGGARIVLTGTADESDVTAAVGSRARAQVRDLTGLTDLGTFTAVIAGAKLLVTNDSGPAHLAAAVATPSVTVFLAGDPARWASPNRARHRTVAAQVSCRPCTLQRCPIDFRCANELPAAAVLHEAQALR